ncbi:uncharacterized protein LOC123429458 [Hordeum vulgare subsp. vulgare]|uniref:uncharacterized protein LOC123429458 n=1 Tax=Hordeum vulgare subsp. vulgare TaxID=112509 RepID=UPI000B468214|nr:uncharacterized protein LOC123429458 [Hordeum vulgare subsp. vulgare]
MDVPESSSQGLSVRRDRGRPRGPRHRSSPPVLIPRPTPVAAAENRRRRMQLNRETLVQNENLTLLKMLPTNPKAVQKTRMHQTIQDRQSNAARGNIWRYYARHSRLNQFLFTN